ncbi:MAG: cupredoxin domain-containing protein [Acidobacteria bacterium]|nr:cupredoxin domain-containing protein [Acidobacteriota bacterium]
MKIPETAKDHYDLAERYKQKAEEYRQEVAMHREMLAEYSKEVAQIPKAIGENPYVKKMRLHCEKYIKAAGELAQDAEEMAKFHIFRARELEGDHPDKKDHTGSDEGDVQSATVELTERGYDPKSLRLKRGIPVRLTFIRKTDDTCGMEVVIPEWNLKRDLPLNEPVVLEFRPDKSGEFSFACGMGMLHGSIVVGGKGIY